MKRTRDDVCAAASQFKRPFGSSRGESDGSKGGGGSRGGGGGVGAEAEAGGGGAPIAVMGGGGDSLQKLTTNDALTYLKEVKQMFQDQKEKYETFLEVMKDFKAQRDDTSGVIARVKELFKGHNNLIYGFNAFLPKGYEIKLDEDEAPPKKTVEFKEAMSFVNKIKKRFQNDDHVYKSFLDILNMYRTEHKDIKEVFIEVASLFVGHPDLLEEFTNFLPKSSANPSSNQVPFGKNTLQRHNERSFASPMMRQILTDNERLKDKVVGSHKDRDLGVDHFEMDNDKAFVNMQMDQSKRIGESRDHKVHDKYYRETEHDDNRDYSMFLFEKRKAPRKIEGLEVNSPEGRDTLRKSITEGYISRSKMEERDRDQNREAKGIQELDFSNCHRCTPSYRLLPDDYQIPTASQRSELGAQVLNDHWVSVTSGSEDYSFNHMRRNQYEESLFRCEDDRFELDMLLESVSSTAKRLEELLKNINDSKVHLDSLRRVEAHLSALNLRCIERLYGDHGLEVMDMLRKNPTLALRVILTRLEQKQDEWTKCRADFNKVWAEIYEKNHYKSLDHRSFYFKQQDSKSLSAKSLVAEIMELKEKNQKEDDLLLAGIAGHRQPLAPHLEYEYSDVSLHDDLYKLVQYSCEEMCSTRDELNKVLRLWTVFLESMLGVQLQSHCVKGTENAGKAMNTAINSNISSLAEYNETGFPVPQNTDVNSRLHQNVNGCVENCPPELSNSCHNVFANGDTISKEHLGLASRDGLKVEKEGKNVDVADKSPGLSVHSSSKEVVNSIASLANAAEDSHGQNNIEVEIGCDANTSRFTDTACEDRQIEVVMDRAAQSEVADAATSVYSENSALANYGAKISRSVENSVRSSKVEKEEGELSPNGDFEEDNFIAYRDDDVEVTPKRKHGIERMQYQSANGEEMNCEDQEGENDFNANADFEGSKNVLEGGGGASGSESAHDDCSGEEHQHEEDLEHDEIDGKAETEGVTDGLADAHFVGGPLPSDRFLLSVRPLTKQVNPALQNRERHDVRTFYANDDFYVLFRLHQILYERILSAKANCTGAEMQRNTFKDMSSSDHYGRFMSALYNLLDGSVGNTKFEDECRAIIGNQSYILFTLDKLIYKLVKQLQTIAMDEMDNKIVQLYEYEKSRKPGWTIDSVYYDDACVLLHEENIYRIESSSSPTRLSIQLMNHVIEKPEPFVLSVNPTFLEYLHNDLLSVFPCKKEPQDIALRRNMRKYVGLDDHAANCIAMEGVELLNGLECKISCNSCKIKYVLHTEDFFFRRRETSQCRSPSNIQARRERFHEFLSASQ